MRFTAQNGSDSGYQAAFNFSSLTDIVMLLLIFFLLTSSFVTTKGLDVVLPDAVNTEKHQDERLFVSVDAEEKISLNENPVTREDLPGLIAAEVQADSMAVVVLRADKELPYRVIVEMLDLIKGAGATRFFLATDRPKN